MSKRAPRSSDAVPHAHTVKVSSAARSGLDVMETPSEAGAALAHVPTGRRLITTKLLAQGETYLVGDVERTDWLYVEVDGKAGWVPRGWTVQVA